MSHGQRRAARLGGLGALAALLAGCLGPPAQRQTWVQVSSERFELLSNADPERALAATRQLELFEAAARRFLATPGGDDGLRTRVHLFRDRASLAGFEYRVDSSGYLLPRLTGSYAVIDAEALGTRPLLSLQHEMTHVLLRGVGSRRTPAWYDEGMAELLSTVEVQGRGLVIGRPPPHRLRWLRKADRVPLEWVMTAPSLEEWFGPSAVSFYAQSWALVHWLRLGHLAGESDRQAQLEGYLERVARGVDAARACRESFGMDFTQLDGALRAYLARDALPRQRIPAAELTLPSSEPALRVLPRAEVAWALGDLALQLGPERLARAERLFREALEADPAHARAHAGLATAQRLGGELDSAGRELEAALRLAPEDPLVQLAQGRQLMTLYAGAAGQIPALRLRLLLQARTHFTHAAELDPQLAAAFLGLGRTFLPQRRGFEPGLEALERARALAPWSSTVVWPLARLRARAGDLDGARTLLREVLRWAHSEEEARAARALLARLAGSAPDLPPDE